MSNIKKYIGPSSFYKRVLIIAIPIMFQQLFNSAMGIVDSIMVSRIGMVTAVGTAAQIEGLMSTVSFGIIAGIGIYAAQFFGANDNTNLKRVFGYSLKLTLICSVFFSIVALLFGKQIIGFYNPDPYIIKNGALYLSIAVFSYIPGSLSFCFSYLYRSIQKTYIPLIIGIVAMLTNVVMNYCLIFGKFGFPEMGIMGAAIATVCAQSVALLANIIYSYASKQPFVGSFKELSNHTRSFTKPILVKIKPLIINELFFGFGMTLFIKAFGYLGTEAMDSYFVGNQISNIFFIAAIGLGSSISAITGAALGKGDIEEAKQMGNYFVGLATILGFASFVLVNVFAPFMVSLFGLPNQEVINMSILILRVYSIRIALRLFIVIVFSSLRSGGDSKYLTFLDAGIMWFVGIPLAFISVNWFKINNIAFVFLICQIEYVVRIILGMRRYSTGVWAKNLTTEVK